MYSLHAMYGSVGHAGQFTFDDRKNIPNWSYHRHHPIDNKNHKPPQGHKIIACAVYLNHALLKISYNFFSVLNSFLHVSL